MRQEVIDKLEYEIITHTRALGILYDYSVGELAYAMGHALAALTASMTLAASHKKKEGKNVSSIDKE